MFAARFHLLAGTVAGLALPAAAALAQGPVRDANFVPSPPTFQPRAATYLWDDGQAEIQYRAPGTSEQGALHAFTVAPGGNLITAVQVAWGITINPRPTRICVWEDPNDDGIPNDAVLLAEFPVQVQNPGTDIFNTYTLPTPVQVSGKFFVGYITGVSNDNFPLRLDRQPNAPAGRYYYLSSNIPINANALAGTYVDWISVGDPGYGMIRAIAASTGFTYQGELKALGAPVNTPVDLRFRLFSAAAAGTQIADTTQLNALTPDNGKFTAVLPYGDDVFTGQTLWLEVDVSPAGANTFTTLTPRQEISAAPAAFYSFQTPWSGLTGVPAGFADGIDNDSGGDITAVFSGPGLTGGANSGNVTLSVNFAGSGTANTVARSDHTTPWTTLVDVPAGFADGIDNDSGGDITAVLSGPGLTGGASSGNATLSANFTASGGLNGTLTTVARGDHTHSSLAASDGSPAVAVSVDAAGAVGVGTTAPFSTLHVRNLALNFTSADLENDDLIVESEDAALGLYSSASGSFGSAIALKEITAGAIVNTWGIVRRTTNGGSSANALRFTFGASSNYAANPYMLQIEQNGNTGIGTSSAFVDARLHVESLNARVAKIDRYGSDGELLAWARDDAIVGSVTVTNGVVTYGAFTGVHYARLDDPAKPFTLVSLTGHNARLADRHDGETIYAVKPSAIPNDPAVLGVYLAHLDGKPLDHHHDLAQVAAVGNTDLWIVDNGSGDILPGDALISSSIAGHAMKDDPETFDVGHVFAVAAQRIDWASIAPDDDGRKRAKASVLLERYHRGVPAKRIRDLEQRLEALESLLGR